MCQEDHPHCALHPSKASKVCHSATSPQGCPRLTHQPLSGRAELSVPSPCWGKCDQDTAFTTQAFVGVEFRLEWLEYLISEALV